MATVEVATGFCDACPTEAHVEAFVFAVMPSGRSLAFCGHCGTRHMDALILQGAQIVDMRNTIEPA